MDWVYKMWFQGVGWEKPQTEGEVKKEGGFLCGGKNIKMKKRPFWARTRFKQRTKAANGEKKWKPQHRVLRASGKGKRGEGVTGKLGKIRVVVGKWGEHAGL